MLYACRTYAHHESPDDDIIPFSKLLNIIKRGIIIAC